MRERDLELLYRSLDGELTPEERLDLEMALAGSADLRRERDEAMAVRGLVKAAASDSFGPFFAEKVVRAVRAMREEGVAGTRFFESLAHAFRRVAIVAAAVAAFLLIYNLNQVGSLSVAAAFGAQETGIEDVLSAPVDDVLEVLM